MNKVKLFLSAVCCFAFFSVQVINANVRLPKIISDGMVLQRNIDVKIWGWADAGEKIAINILDKTYSTVTGTDGKWIITLDKFEAGGPYKMEINANNKIVINDILFGDVWFCSGQSNMETPISRLEDKFPEEIATSENPFIREFAVPRSCDFNSPQEDIPAAKWESANPQSIKNFSAVAYFFARELFEKYKVPIGILRSAVGGSPAEAWISEDALKEFPHYLQIAEKYKDDAFVKKLASEDKIKLDAWYESLWKEDKGLHEEKIWHDINYDASGWQKMNLPAFWEDEGLPELDGVVWFRKEIEVPATMIGKPAILLLGRIVDSDSAFVNGKFVGNVTYQYPPRKYEVPANLLNEGKNIIVVRVVNNRNKGGFIKDKPYLLKVDGEQIDLKGEWQYKVGAKVEPIPSASTPLQYLPLGLYNGMIAPFLNYDFKAFLWYQGEANANRAKEYQKLLPALINNWRQKWNKKDLPFLFVQLPNYMEVKEQPSESEWAEQREAQFKTLSVPNTAMAVAIDLGEWNDIHPLNKKDVGRRLCLAAMNLVYGEKNIIASGPIFQSAKIEGNKITVSFSNIGGGLIAKGGGELKYFAIASADKKFIWANAKIKNDKVVVWNEKINEPKYVRYAWADNPDGANLYNAEGLPASPFRTDE
jgi:sialate O-acetylesterase